MRYYISDLHFFHEKLNDEMDNRGFRDVEEMHNYIINRWNARVNKRDEVIILGDLSYGKAEETNELLSRLNGKLCLIRGNHDSLYLNKTAFDESRFEWIKIVLCHYPIMCYNGQYRLNTEGKPKTFMLYGHVHDTHDQRLIEEFIRITRETKSCYKDGTVKNIPCNMINCFCMYSDYTPWTLDEWIVYWRERGTVE